MTTKKRSGVAALASLVSKQDDANHGTLSTLDISSIVQAPIQDRTKFDEKKLEALAATIKKNGNSDPILVRPLESGDYEIVAGERRWRACNMLGHKTMTVIVKDLTDEQAEFHMFAENIGRETLNPIEIASGLKRRQDKFGTTIDELALDYGKSVSWVKTHLAYNNFPEGTKALAADEVVVYHDSLRKLKRLE